MTPPTLTQQLADYKAGFIQRVPPERLAMMEGATGSHFLQGGLVPLLQPGAAGLATATGCPRQVGRKVGRHIATNAGQFALNSREKRTGIPRAERFKLAGSPWLWRCFRDATTVD